MYLTNASSLMIWPVNFCQIDVEINSIDALTFTIKLPGVKELIKVN